MATALRGFFDEAAAPDRRLAVVNRSSPAAVCDLIDSLLGAQSVQLSEHEHAGGDTDIVVLIEDGEILAQSTVDELLESVLLINSDVYKTGARPLEEAWLPAVFKRLDEVPFRVCGYPASDKEKMLLIAMSRVIERRAAESSGGRLRASFQRLSRITDEQGTERVYTALGESETDVHVYGVADPEYRLSLPVAVHTGRSEEYRRSWFVVFTPPESSTSGAEHAALVALEDEPNVWDGFWTFQPRLVDRIERYIATTL